MTDADRTSFEMHVTYSCMLYETFQVMHTYV